MTTLDEWKRHREEWLDLDLKLMTSNEGWKVAKQKGDITIWNRSFPDDKNQLFRWIIPDVDADHRTVCDIFVNKLHDYHHYWTKEYTGGYDVMTIDEQARISYQQYDSGYALISNRDWVAIQWMREIDDKRLQVSFRTVMHPDRPPVKGYERIDWWGAHLFEANPDGTTRLYLIDRENQGGWFPFFLMNRMMPGYLIYQYKAIREFFQKGGESAHDALPSEKNSALVQKNHIP